MIPNSLLDAAIGESRPGVKGELGLYLAQEWKDRNRSIICRALKRRSHTGDNGDGGISSHDRFACLRKVSIPIKVLRRLFGVGVTSIGKKN